MATHFLGMQCEGDGVCEPFCTNVTGLVLHFTACLSTFACFGAATCSSATYSRVDLGAQLNTEVSDGAKAIITNIPVPNRGNGGRHRSPLFDTAFLACVRKFKMSNSARISERTHTHNVLYVHSYYTKLLPVYSRVSGTRSLFSLAGAQRARCL